MTEKMFLLWLRKAAKKWEPMVIESAIRLRAENFCLCPAEAVQVISKIKNRFGEIPTPAEAEGRFCDAIRQLKIDRLDIAGAADSPIPHLSPRMAKRRERMLAACGLKEQILTEKRLVACPSKS